MANKLKSLLTVKQTAKLLKKHPSTVRRWIKERKLPAVKLGGRYGLYLLERDDVLQYMIQNLIKQ